MIAWSLSRADIYWITNDMVLRARGKMIWNKANGPADCLVTETLQCLPMETVYEVTHCFENRFKGECRAPEAWKILRFVFLKKLDAKLEKGAFARLHCCVLKVVHDGSGGSTARGEGAD